MLSKSNIIYTHVITEYNILYCVCAIYCSLYHCVFPSNILGSEFRKKTTFCRVQLVGTDQLMSSHFGRERINIP